MPLEDHLGDVIAKARAHRNVSLAEAAQAADLTPQELERFENTGQPPFPPNLSSLGRLLGLQAERLARLAHGWLPLPAHLPTWRHFHAFTTTGPSFSVNCYLAWDAPSRDAALFDTGFDPAPILECILRHQLNLRYIFITHSHHDHIVALPAIHQQHPKALVLAQSPERVSSSAQALKLNPPVPLGQLQIAPRPTPGHAPDGISYVISQWPDHAPPVAVVGDALFAASMGRAAGNAAQALHHIRHEILSLPPQTLLCPGHGPLTTVGEEAQFNPFL